jgi:glycosyltransferase involved in cell wall biosynthesis
MLDQQKVVVVMPAYNAGATLLKTWREVIQHEIVDLVIVVDDASRDDTLELARTLPKVIAHGHQANLGYGANQKTCYRLALEHGADIIVMVHPDYQYTPKLIPAMAGLVASGLYACVLGSRILGGGALKGGMPSWRYVSNRGLTLIGNLLMGTKLSEFHSGYRAFSRELLERLPLDANSDDFIFFQSDPRRGRVAEFADWRGLVSHELCTGIIVHQLLAKREIRVWLFEHCDAVPAGANGFVALEAVPNDRDALDGNAFGNSPPSARAGLPPQTSP